MRTQQLAAMARHEPLVALVGERTEKILIQQQISLMGSISQVVDRQQLGGALVAGKRIQKLRFPLGIQAVAISPDRTSLSSVFTAGGWLAACRRKVAAERALSTMTSTRSPSKTKARRARGRSCQCGTEHSDTQAQRHTDGNAVETGQGT